MKIRVKNTQTDQHLGLSKAVVITSFRQVTVFGDDYTKIIYRHSANDYTIETVGSRDDVQVISGPRAEEIIVSIIETEKKKHSTFVWTGAHFINATYHNFGYDKASKRNNLHYPNHLIWDPIINEEERRVLRDDNNK